MKLRFFSTVENENHRRRVAYILKNFSIFAGVRILTDQEGDFTIAYADEPGRFNEKIFIKKSDEAINLFERRLSLTDVMDVARIHFIKLEPPFVPDEIGSFNMPVFFQAGEPILNIADGRAEINFDILSCAFYILSSWDERVKKSRDEFGRFPDDENLCVKLNTHEIPLVDFYFRFLFVLMQSLGFNEFSQRLWNGRNFAVCITHDVDLVRKWTPFGIYNEAMNKFIMGKEEIIARRERFGKFVYSLLSGKDPYRDGLLKIFEFEKSHDVKATFFMKTGASSKYDVNYRWDDFLKNFALRLKGSGFEIALHPSFNSFANFDLMLSEKKRLEEFVGEVSGVRQHYLRYDFSKTLSIHERLGFKYDSSLGFLKHSGFRCGYSMPFKIFDVEGNRESDVVEIPLVFMDSVYQYGKSSEDIEAIGERLRKIIDMVKQSRGAVSVLFHNTIYDEFDFVGWENLFENFVKEMKQFEAYLGTCSEVVLNFEKVVAEFS